MSCCGPQRAPDLDPEHEGPSEADLERFGGDEFDPRELDDDFTTEKSASVARKAVYAIGALGALIGMLMLVGVL